MNKYNINNKTMAILATNRGESIVYEDSRFFIIKSNPNFIIKKNCLNYGKSLEGAMNITKILIGVSYKPPIIINEYQNIIFFPTRSVRLNSNEWICLNKIKNFYENKINHKTLIEFNNGKVLEFDISYNIMKNQILRAHYLESKNQPINDYNI